MTLEFENELGDIRTVSIQERLRKVRVQPLVTGDLAPFFSHAGAPSDWGTSIFGQKTQENITSMLDLVSAHPPDCLPFLRRQLRSAN